MPRERSLTAGTFPEADQGDNEDYQISGMNRCFTQSDS